MKTNKELRLEKKNKKWLERYGVKYTDCLEKKEKTKNKKTKKVNYVKKMLFITKGFKSTFIVFFILGIITAGLGIVVPICWQHLIDDITNANFNNLIYYALVICAMTIIIRLLTHRTFDLINISYNKMAHKMRFKLISNIADVNITKFDKTSSGEIMNRVDYSSSNFSAAIVNVISIIPDILGNIVFIVYGCIINIWLGLILVVVGSSSYIVGKTYNKYFLSKYKKCSNLIWDKRTSQYTELIRGIRDIKALNSKKFVLDRIKKVSYNTVNAGIKQVTSIQKAKTLTATIKAVGLLGFLVLGVIFVQNSIVTIGSLIVLIMYRDYFFSFFDNLAECAESVLDLRIHAERIYQIMNDKDYKKEKFGSKTIKNPKGKISFKKVKFAYNKKKTLFENLNFTIKPHECIGFVGKSGQGKSTIMSLITKFYEASSGKILIDGININDLTENSLRGNISVVPQSPYIFNLSIKENLLIANPKATDKQIKMACQKAFIDDFIETLPNKYNTIVGEGGVTLSGGQKQRISIARVFLKPSKILLFDEATSAIDNDSQAKIFASIQELRKTHTVIIVAHRLSTIRDCDRIFVLDNHEIVDIGTHDELMKKSKIYKNLYNTEESS